MGQRKERVKHGHDGAKWIKRMASEIVFQPFIETLALRLHDEHMRGNEFAP